MAAALHNRMARSDTGNDLIAPENRFKQQVSAVMDCTQKQDWKLLDKEIRKLLDVAGELKDTNILTSALFIAAEACYAIREYKHSIKYSDDTIREAEKAMDNGEAAGYSYWKMATSMKAAVLTAEKNGRKQLHCMRDWRRKLSDKKIPTMSWKVIVCVAFTLRGRPAESGFRVFSACFGSRELSFRRNQTELHVYLCGISGAPHWQAGTCAD